MAEGGRRDAAGVFMGCADTEPDRTGVRQFRDDLRDWLQLHIGQHAAPSVSLGVDLPAGHEWRRELVRLCATARANISLCSTSFFASRWCGREWAIFVERVERTRSAGAPPLPWILTVNWIPVWGAAPKIVRDVQTAEWTLTPDDALESAYRREGLYFLQQHEPDGYGKLCRALAGKVATALDHDLTPISDDEAASIEPSFPASVETGRKPESGAGERSPEIEPHQTPAPSVDGRMRPTPTTTRRAVADVLTTVSALQDVQTWRSFVSDIVTQRGRRILRAAVFQGPDREEALLDLLCTQHGPQLACDYVVGALETVPDSARQLAEIVAIRDRLNGNGPGSGR